VTIRAFAIQQRFVNELCDTIDQVSISPTFYFAAFCTKEFFLKLYCSKSLDLLYFDILRAAFHTKDFCV